MDEGVFRGGQMAKLKTGPKVKRKGGGIPAKAKKVEGLAGELGGNVSLVITDFRGLKVGELQALRRRLRPRGIEYHVVKNSVFVRAAEQSGKGELRSMLAGPTAVAIGDGDEVELAKSLVDEARALKALKILGALIGGRTMGAEDVQSLARLPSRPQLQAMIVGAVQAPLAQMVGVLTAAQGNLVRVLQARGSQ
jgi:large subunit ribosomal protein L10